MDLWHYLRILRRSWPLVLGLPLVVAVVTVLLWLFGPATYGMRVALIVTQRPLATNEATVSLPDYNSFNSWATSEYIVDDLLQVVTMRQYAQDIVAYAKAQHNADLDPEAVQQGLSAERKHRTVYLEVEADTPEHAVLMADGAIAMLEQKGLEYWGRGDSAKLDVAVGDRPDTAARVGGIAGLALDLVIRVLLAFLLAVGIAFLLHYLDQTLHRENDVEALGLEVIGTIPLAKGAKV